MARDEIAEAEFVAKKIIEIKKKTGCSLAGFRGAIPHQRPIEKLGGSSY